VPSEESPGNRSGAYRDRTGDLRLAKPLRAESAVAREAV
jgi:hypothetical protein